MQQLLCGLGDSKALTEVKNICCDSLENLELEDKLNTERSGTLILKVEDFELSKVCGGLPPLPHLPKSKREIKTAQI